MCGLVNGIYHINVIIMVSQMYARVHDEIARGLSFFAVLVCYCSLYVWMGWVR